MRHLLVAFMIASSSAQRNGPSRVNQKFYKITESFLFCFRRLNATHSVGCASNFDGDNVGMIFLLRSFAEMQKYKDFKENRNLVVVMSLKIFADDQFMATLQKDKRIKGVVLYEPKDLSEQPKNFSVDTRCPNSRLNDFVEKFCWNPFGRGYFFWSWNFPIIMFPLSQRKTVDFIEKCAERFNAGDAADGRRCSMEIKLSMDAVNNSRTCLRRRLLVENFAAYSIAHLVQSQFCQPLAADNFLYVFAPHINAINKTILVLARVDALSMFTNVTFGSYAVYPALGVFLTLASAFAQLNSRQEPQRRVVFLLLDGESLDNMGAARIVRAMHSRDFLKPFIGASLHIDHIDTVLELGQLSSGALNTTFYAHTRLQSGAELRDIAWTYQLVKDSANFGANLSVLKDDVLPPASMKIFLKARPSISAIFLSDFKNRYRANYFHSFLDNKRNLDAINLIKLTKVMYATLHKMVFGASPKILINESASMEILDCFYNVSACRLLREVRNRLYQELPLNLHS